MPLHGDSSPPRSSRPPSGAEQRCSDLRWLAPLNSSFFESDAQEQATRPSCHATDCTSYPAAITRREGAPSCRAPSQRVSSVVANGVGRVSACSQSLIDDSINRPPCSHPPPSYHRPVQPYRLPLPLDPSKVYFDRDKWRIHLPADCPVLAILQINLSTNTVYLTVPDRLPLLPLTASTSVVYARKRRHPLHQIDLLDDRLALNKGAFKTRAARKTRRSLRKLNDQLVYHLQRQDDFMRCARIYSEDRIRARGGTNSLTLDPDATTAILGIPYFEHYMFKVADRHEWGCEDITKIYDPPDLELR